MKNGALERLVREAETDPTVLAVVLFGSAVRGQAGSESDLDVCLVLAAAHSAVALERRLKGLVDFEAFTGQVLRRLREDAPGG